MGADAAVLYVPVDYTRIWRGCKERLSPGPFLELPDDPAAVPEAIAAKEAVGDLADKSEKDLLQCRNVGVTTVEELKKKLAIFNLALRKDS